MEPQDWGQQLKERLLGTEQIQEGCGGSSLQEPEVPGPWSGGRGETGLSLLSPSALGPQGGQSRTLWKPQDEPSKGSKAGPRDISDPVQSTPLANLRSISWGAHLCLSVSLDTPSHPDHWLRRRGTKASQEVGLQEEQ